MAELCIFVQIFAIIKVCINLAGSCMVLAPHVVHLCYELRTGNIKQCTRIGKVVDVRHIIATRLIPASIRQRAAGSRSMPQICMWNGALCLPCVVKEGTNWNLNELWNDGSANTVSIFLQHKGLFGVFFGQPHINWTIHAGEKYKVTRKFQIYESHESWYSSLCLYLCFSNGL